MGSARTALTRVLPVVVAFALVVAGAGPLVAAEAPRADAAGAWLRPVDGAVVHPFEAPSSVYGAGHRGVDFSAAPDTPVRAANDGQVTFAGSVAGTLHVTITHAGGLRTSYSFLATVAVRTGSTIARGDVVGTTGGTSAPGDGAGHERTVLHLGLRLGDDYLDPMLLFGPADLTRIVHLAPTRDPDEAPWTAADERRELQLSLRLPVPGTVPGGAPDSADGAGGGGCGDSIPLVGGVVSVTCDVATVVGNATAAALHSALDAGLVVVHSLAGTAADSLDGLRAQLVATLDRLRSVSAAVARNLARTPMGTLALDLVAIGRRFVGTLVAECSDDAPPADGTGGSTHRVMVVGGINSSGLAGSAGPTVDLDVGALGYRPADGEVRWFSYADDGGSYRAAETYGPLDAAAQQLYEQLQAMQREEPGREVDLVAHSQGGLVIDVFLLDHYSADDPTLPPLGNVVTVSSPHEGAPLATAGARLRDTFLAGVVDRVSPVPLDAASLGDMSERSKLIARIQRAGVREHFDYTTIGVAEDLVVPASNISLRGATETVVAVNAANQHSAVLHDADALRAIRASLEGRAPPCVDVGTALRSAVAPVVISRVEHTAGGAGATLAGGA